MDDYGHPDLTRAQVDATPGPVVLEFGTGWCPHCQSLAPTLSAALAEYPGVTLVKVEDGPGRPLGRSFRVKLWPTLVFLKDGQPVEQVARPDAEAVRRGLAAIAAG